MAVMVVAAAVPLFLGAEPASNSFVSANACSACHRDQFTRQASSAHAHALFRARYHPLADSFLASTSLKREPNYRFEFSPDNGMLRTRIAHGVDLMELPMGVWRRSAGSDLRHESQQGLVYRTLL